MLRTLQAKVTPRPPPRRPDGPSTDHCGRALDPRGASRLRITADHELRIARTVSHIDAHLREPLDLDALASFACFSKYHFHRVFKAAMVMSPQEYLTARRLEWAYRFLVSAPHLPVSEVSALLGFSTPSNLTRAFRRRFGFLPRAVRRSAAAFGDDFSVVDPLRVELELLPAFRIAYVRQKGVPCPEMVLPALSRIHAECQRQGWKTSPGARKVVVMRTLAGLARGDHLTYDVGVELTEAIEFDDPGKVQVLGGGSYARYDYLAPPDDSLEACWEELETQWIGRSGLSIGEGFSFTLVPAAPVTHSGQLRFRLYLPIRAVATFRGPGVPASQRRG